MARYHSWKLRSSRDLNIEFIEYIRRYFTAAIGFVDLARSLEKEKRADQHPQQKREKRNREREVQLAPAGRL